VRFGSVLYTKDRAELANHGPQARGFFEMADDPGILIGLGVKMPDLIAGFAGGVVNAIALKRSDPWSIIGSVVVGGLTANYLTDPFTHYLGTGQQTSGFLVGLAGMAICQGIIAGAAKWNPFSASRTNPDARPGP
jgi:hypothetical protein